MSDAVKLRSGRDRLRYTIAFEALLMAMLIPAGAAAFDKPLAEVGALGAALSVKAMTLGLIYNWIFDRIDARAGRVASARSTRGRLLHALGFEAVLTLSSLPLYVLGLGIGVGEALAADLAITSFVVAYTYAFTLGYDRLFPLAGPGAAVRA